ncbi:MAG: vWA domain-containing protein [Polyangiaceae bacterium]
MGLGRALRVVGSLLGLGFGTLVACGESPPGSNFDDASTGGNGGTAGSTGRVDSGSGSDATTSTNDAGFGGNTDSSTDDPDALVACATETAAAKAFPLDIYVMMDSSGSMSDPTSAGPTKWEAVKSAVTSFVQEPQSAGIGLGIQFFPLLDPGSPTSCATSNECGAFGPCENKACGPAPGQSGNIDFIPCAGNSDCPANRNCQALCDCSTGGTFFIPVGNNSNTLACSGGGTCTRIATAECSKRFSCNAAQYDVPEVNLVALPGGANAIIMAMNRTPSGSTPTAPALTGAISRARTLAAANPTHSTIALLVTDGLPTICAPTDIASIANVAANGLAANPDAGIPGVKTFVVGVFADAEANEARTNLNMIAQSGGTNQAFIISTNQNVAQQFLAALNTVRASALPCDYELPRPDSGMPDFDKVNVRFTPSTGGAETLPYVGSVGGCAGVPRGWYYDVPPSNGVTPSKISMCPDICTALKADTQGKVDVLLGCKTQIR